MTADEHSLRHCDRCGTPIHSTPESRAAAEAEAKELHGFCPSEETRHVICDDCFAFFRKWWDALSPAERERIVRKARAMEPS